MLKMERIATVLIIFLACHVYRIQGHGRLVDPPSRNAMWDYGFPNKENYDMNQLNCGGFDNQHKKQGGKCGVCGDPYQGPKKHETSYSGQGYANGIIARVYKEGQSVEVRVDITANHRGFFQFKLCDPKDGPEDQHCFDRHLLANEQGQTQHHVNLALYKGTAKFRLRLPAGVTCAKCVLQWFWQTGNNIGILEQETFINCADVLITKQDGTLGQGRALPTVLDAAYESIPENKQTLGRGFQDDLPGKWTCEAANQRRGKDEKIFEGWCYENCLYAYPGQRNCPLNTCYCHRVDQNMDPAEERRLLGMSEESTRGSLEGTWECSVVEPYGHDRFHDWCRIHCLEVLPNERDCPETHCYCTRTDVSLSREEEIRLLLPSSSANGRNTPAPASRRRTTNGPSRRSTVAPTTRNRPGSKNIQYTCEAVGAFRTGGRQEAGIVRHCYEICANQPPEDRDCPESHCRCYETNNSHVVLRTPTRARNQIRTPQRSPTRRQGSRQHPHGNRG